MGSFKIAKTVLRSMFRKPATVKYPAEPIEYEEMTRGHVGIVAEQCILCGICSKKCPTDAISVNKGERTWIIERMLCIQCGHCVEVCPKHCLNMEPQYTAPDVMKTVDTVNVPEQSKTKTDEP